MAWSAASASAIRRSLARSFSSLSNYYTLRYAPIVDGERGRAALGGATAFGIFALAVVVIIAGPAGLDRRQTVSSRNCQEMLLHSVLAPYRASHRGCLVQRRLGRPEGALGVVVKLDGREIHIGSGKTMHYLYSALLAAR